MTAIVEPIISSQDAPPVCLAPWSENPYGLVSLWDMLNFDAGRLVKAMQYVAELSRILESSDFRGHSFALFDGKALAVENTRDTAQYCEEMGYVMTKITLDRILNLMDNPRIAMEGMAELYGEATRRLRDEAGIHKLLKLAPEKIKHYETPFEGWEGIIEVFPGSSDDVEEMNRCFALSRYPAAIFHSLLVVEHGVVRLGKTLGVTDPKEGWDATCKKMEAILKAGHSATVPGGLDFEFVQQVNVLIQAMKHAWRNKVNHVAGKFVVIRSGFGEEITEEIISATRSLMRTLAQGLPR